MAKDGKKKTSSRKDQRRKFKGIYIPAALWMNENLKASEKSVIAEVDSLDVDGKGCFASNTHFAKILGNTPARASKIINQMVKKGLLSSRIDSADANRRYLKVLSSKTGIVLSSETTIGSRRNRIDPIVENDETLNKEEVNSEVNRERELPLPDFLNEEKTKGKIYLSARAEYLLSTIGFDSWFENEVLMRFTKFNANTINKTTLRDWDKLIFERYGKDIATAAVLDLIENKPNLNGNVPGAGEVKKVAAKIKRQIDTEQNRQRALEEQKKNQPTTAAADELDLPWRKDTIAELQAELEKQTEAGNAFNVSMITKELEKRKPKAVVPASKSLEEQKQELAKS
jgi:DNA-binding MarR family transcriptional regulator